MHNSRTTSALQEATTLHITMAFFRTLAQLAHSQRTIMNFLTWLEILRSGVGIGLGLTVATRRMIRAALPWAPTASLGVTALGTGQLTAGQRSASATPLRTKP